MDYLLVGKLMAGITTFYGVLWAVYKVTMMAMNNYYSKDESNKLFVFERSCQKANANEKESIERLEKRFDKLEDNMTDQYRELQTILINKKFEK